MDAGRAVAAGDALAEATGDLRVPPARGIPAGLLLPRRELVERFSRSSGPGGQSVNTTDSRVELGSTSPVPQR